MKRSESIRELTTALAKAQGEMGDASKDGTNPHFGQSYATLSSVWEACRGALSRHGLAVIQTPSTTETGDMAITTLLSHAGGEWIEDTLVLVPRDKSPQSFGSAVTYGRRYALMAMVGIAPGEDDDGNAASGAGDGKAKKPAAKPKETPAPTPPGPKPLPQPSAVVVPPRMHVLSEVMNSIPSVNWPMGSVNEFMQLAYGTKSLSEISEAVFADLLARVKTQTFSQAKVDVKTHAKKLTAPPALAAAEQGGDLPFEHEPGAQG